VLPACSGRPDWCKRAKLYTRACCRDQRGHVG
jgi:hypothetical protein